MLSTSSAQARPRRKDSSVETILCTPSREIESLRRRMMFWSERDCQRWRSFDMIPAISKARTPTVDFLEGEGVGVCLVGLGVVRAVLSFIIQVSSAMSEKVVVWSVVLVSEVERDGKWNE